MKGTLTEKLLRSHLVEGMPAPGSEIGLRIDQTLTQDATGTMAYLEFESMGIARVRVGLAVSYVDHNIIQTDFKNADDHRFLRSCAAKFGVIYSGPGNGVSHHVHRQRFGKPGETLLGSDSHTTTGGCLGMLAMGAGGIEVALAMAGKPYHIVTPKVWGVRVTGSLPPYVSGKDVILELLRVYSSKGGLEKVVEFFGPGVANLDMAARATIANMSVDMGCTAGVFPSDNVTREYLARNNRESDWKELLADGDAQYDEVTDLDLGKVEPLVACPSNPDNVKRAADLGNVSVQQVIVGSSCNGSFRDFMTVANIVEGKMKRPDVDFEVNTGSRQTLVNVMMAGGTQALVQAGARVHEPGCLGCIGMGQAPATGTVSLRTFPRNFKGRSGTKDDKVYLCSPETAAASVLTGRITDPRTLGGPRPEVTYPKTYFFKPEWFELPPADGSGVEILRGPNIKPFPRFSSLPENISGEVLIKVGDNISTDIIMPGGSRVLPLRSNIPAISEFVFEPFDGDFAARAKAKGGGIVIGGENYGQGSSREHAALAPRYLGVTVKIAKSFARIHKANLVSFGIVPLTFADPADYDFINRGDAISVDGIRRRVEKGDVDIPVHAGGKEIRTKLDVSDRQRKVLLAGGVLNLGAQ
jgi:aconitate hydratase